MAANPARSRRGDLGERVYLLLWERILDDRLHAGQKLSDIHLSDKPGGSRTPAREALQRLVRDGILRLEPTLGFSVTFFSSQDIAEIDDLRATLESWHWSWPCLATRPRR